MTEYKKKLIEVALPLDVINEASAREKAIPHGSPAALHVWWARRPLAASRAVVFAQLVDDPSARPDEFPDELSQEEERRRLFELIAALVKWESGTDEGLLAAARTEIRKSVGDQTRVVDPFAGGGSIPLEAQRLGVEVVAGDLNPVAVSINQALLEVVVRHEGRSPIHPDAELRAGWSGAEGLVEDVRCFGRSIYDELKVRIGSVYLPVLMPDGTQEIPIAWIWARTSTCSNPGCGALLPLINSMWLSKKKGNEHYISLDRDLCLSIGSGAGSPETSLKVTSRGANFRCVQCGQITPAEHIQETLLKHVDQHFPIAACVERGRRRTFVPFQLDFVEAVESYDSPTFPELSRSTRHMGGVSYGLARADHFHTPRQRMLLATGCQLVREAISEAESLGADAEYARHLGLLLGLSISKSARFHTTLTNWRADRQQLSRAFGGPAMEMTWDFAEANPFGGQAGDMLGMFESTARALEALRPSAKATVIQGDAASVLARQDNDTVLCTDPPYYDNVPYSDLADFFYGWLRLALGDEYPELFATALTPKIDEIVADAQRAGSASEAEEFFSQRFRSVFQSASDNVGDRAPMVVFYAFKQGEKIKSTDDLIASTGWSTMLESLVGAGWSIVATWPMVTEGQTRRRGIGSNALMSSIVLACRRRSVTAGVTDRLGFMRLLRAELLEPVELLQRSNIAPVDLRQAAIGPGMSVYSRFERVVEADGGVMPVRIALGLINQVLDEILEEQQQAFDAETRWAMTWFSQFYFDEGPYGTAEQLAVSMDVSMPGLVGSGILESGGGRVRLLSRRELADGWDPRSDRHTSVWEATQHLVKRLESDGEASAARLLGRMPALGESAQLLAYRLYTLCERSRPNLAGPFNALVASWPEIQRLAQEADAPIVEFEQQRFDT